MRPCRFRAALLLLLGLAACSRGGWREARADDPALAQRRDLAAAARDEFARSLLGELSTALAEGGPERAVVVCRDRAPALARSVGAARGVALGRTSQRLRNTANRAPAWAAAFVGSAATEPAFFRGPEGQLGALHPIRLMPMCLQCHGRPDEIAAPVHEALRTTYPADTATGFAVGDLRGWFWVEVP